MLEMLRSHSLLRAASEVIRFEGSRQSIESSRSNAGLGMLQTDRKHTSDTSGAQSVSGRVRQSEAQDEPTLQTSPVSIVDR